MKEAAGEANMTVVTIVLIAIVLGIGTVLVTNVMNQTKTSSNCTSKGGQMFGGKCCYNTEVDQKTGKVIGCND